MKWSNGDEVKASDFVNSWNRAASTELGADYGYMFEIVDGYAEMQEDTTGEKKLNAIADDAAGTITITIENAVNYWNELLAFPTYYPVHSSAYDNEAWATDPSTYICNGPYTMASWDHNSVITLKKNPNYFDAANVKMEEIKMFLSDDANNMLSNFKNGSWLLIDDVPTNEIATLKKDYADLEEAYRAITGFDMAKAQKLMQEAYDYAVANGLYADGEIIKIRFSVYSTDTIYNQMYEYVKAQLNEAVKGTSLEGKIELEMFADADYYNSLYAGNTDIIFSTWGGATYGTLTTMAQIYCDDYEGNGNQMEIGFNTDAYAVKYDKNWKRRKTKRNLLKRTMQMQ